MEKRINEWTVAKTLELRKPKMDNTKITIKKLEERSRERFNEKINLANKRVPQPKAVNKIEDPTV